MVGKSTNAFWMGILSRAKAGGGGGLINVQFEWFIAVLMVKTPPISSYIFENNLEAVVKQYDETHCNIRKLCLF